MTDEFQIQVPRFGGSSILAITTDAEVLQTVRTLESLAETTMATGDDALAVLSRLDADVIVVDQQEAEKNGGQLLDGVTAARPSAIRILLNGGVSSNGAAHAPDLAVLAKPVDPHALRSVCTMALRCAVARRTARELEHENNRLRGVDTETVAFAPDEMPDLERYDGLLTCSAPMKTVFSLLRRIEDNETTVLIHGETGTGKELVAKAIHEHSRRRAGRFVAVNLGAISDPLRESELFGHVRGAFTGATESRGGLFMEANGGCIFLDEVGDASPGLQVALLRVLEEGTITPVGADRPRRVDVRVISGTNRNLEELVSQGRFRRDLYYRLNVFPIELPPLRERPEDIFPLAKHFLALASVAMGKRQPDISREARAVLEGYHWEGNVRELRNVMERAAILCKGGLVIAADLPVTWHRKPAGNGDASASTIAIPPGGATLQALEREIFVKTLALSGGNQSRAAQMLGLCESTFRFRLQKLGIASRRAARQPAQPAATTQLVANG